MSDRLDSRAQQVERDMQAIVEAFRFVAREVGEIQLVSERLAPDGLMRKARSVSWLVEQVCIQQLVQHAEEAGVNVVDVPEDDLIRHDVLLEVPGSEVRHFVNVKTGLVDSGVNKDDVSKADKLARFYADELEDGRPFSYLLVNVKVGLLDDNRALEIVPDAVSVANVAWLPQEEVYVNPSNKNLQARPDKPREVRSNLEFLSVLVGGPKGILEKDVTISIDDVDWDRVLKMVE